MRSFLAVAVGLALGLASLPGNAYSDSGDASATRAYLMADYTLMRTVSAHLPRSETALLGLLAHVRQVCPLAAEHSPQNPQSTQLSNELIGTMVLTGGHVDRRAVQAYVNTAKRLRWSSRRVNREVQFHVRSLQTLLSLATPDICADVKSWAASGFSALPAHTIQFARVFIEGWVRPGTLPSQLALFEQGSDRVLAHRASQLEDRVTDFEAAEVETWGKIMDALVLLP
jgi:hypothetical protein